MFSCNLTSGIGWALCASPYKACCSLYSISHVCLFPQTRHVSAQTRQWTKLTCLANKMCSRVCGMGPSAAETTRMAPSICTANTVDHARHHAQCLKLTMSWVWYTPAASKEASVCWLCRGQETALKHVQTQTCRIRQPRQWSSESCTKQSSVCHRSWPTCAAPVIMFLT